MKTPRLGLDRVGGNYTVFPQEGRDRPQVLSGTATVIPEIRIFIDRMPESPWLQLSWNYGSIGGL